MTRGGFVVATAAAGAMVLVAAMAAASNTGYLVRITLQAGGPAGGVTWLSLPSAYAPPDANTNARVDAEDLVQDLQPQALPRPCTLAAANCAVARVWKWDPATGEYTSWAGGQSTGNPFDLEPGVGYGLELRAVNGQTTHHLDLLGIHASSFELSDCHTPGGVNMRWISLPLHLDLGTERGVPGVADAEDLGQALGGPDHVFQIRRLDEASGRFENWVVGSSYGTPFEIDMTRAYAVDLTCADLAAPCQDCQWTWLPRTF